MCYGVVWETDTNQKQNIQQKWTQAAKSSKTLFPATYFH